MAHKCPHPVPPSAPAKPYNRNFAMEQQGYEQAWRKRQQTIALWLGATLMGLILAVALFGFATDAKAEEQKPNGTTANLRVAQSELLKPYRCPSEAPKPSAEESRDIVVLCFLTDGKTGCVNLNAGK